MGNGPGPICGETNNPTCSTPGPTGWNDAGDPDRPVLLARNNAPLTPGAAPIAQRGKSGRRPRYTMEVRILVVRGTKTSRTIRPHGAARTFRTNEVVWEAEPGLVLEQIKAARKIWGVDFTYRGKSIYGHGADTGLKSAIWYFQEGLFLREVSILGGPTIDAINRFLKKHPTIDQKPPLLIFTDMHKDHYSKEDGRPTIGGFTALEEDHPELITDVSFIFSDRTSIVGPSGGFLAPMHTAAHELYHVVASKAHARDPQNLMTRKPVEVRPHHEPPIRGQVTSTQRKAFLLGGQKKGYIRDRRKQGP